MVMNHRLLLNQLLTVAVLFPNLALATPPTTPDDPRSLTAPSSELTALEGLQGHFGLSNQGRFFQGFLPLLKEGQELLFIQGHWHHQKPRHLLGIGLGHRLLVDEQWGMGYNLFFDHDASQHHQRLGVGGELWVDGAKLAVNGYLPVSKPRAVAKQPVTSRPAKGFDLGLQAYLPQHPQLGAAIRYAYSVGDQIAGHDTASRQKNPKNWSMGLSYTPVPLMTVEYSHQSNNLYRKGKEQRIGATLSYQLGLPLAQQCDPTQAVLLRSLSGQLLSPVSRQRDMVLSYRQVPAAAAAAAPSRARASMGHPGNPPAPAALPGGGLPQPGWSPIEPDPNDAD